MSGGAQPNPSQTQPLAGWYIKDGNIMVLPELVSWAHDRLTMYHLYAGIACQAHVGGHVSVLLFAASGASFFAPVVRLRSRIATRGGGESSSRFLVFNRLTWPVDIDLLA